MIFFLNFSTGLHLKVKVSFNHIIRDFIHLQLESVPNEQISNNSNIILETGDLFKGIETKTLFKHKIVVLDQVIVQAHIHEK